jgi:hypothetical protein
MLLLITAAALATASGAGAEPALIAEGTLIASTAGPGADLSGLTGALENGVPANVLGGIGSALAYAGGGIFLATPDRGPNAAEYNAKVDHTVTFIPRFHTIAMTLAEAAPGAALPFRLMPALTGTTLLWSATPLAYGSGAGLGVGPGAPAKNEPGRYYFAGRSDDFDPAGDSCAPGHARLDLEGIRVAADGKSVFVSDEYGPFVYQFDRATGERLRAYAMPANLCSPHLFPLGDAEIGENKIGRTANKGMEGLAITPDGKTLVGVVQAALVGEAGDAATGKMVRILTIDVATGATRQYGYLLTDGSGISEILAVNDHEFLLDERDGKGLGDGSAAKVKKLFRVDLAGATDISGMTGEAAARAAVKKTLFFDLVAALASRGVAAEGVPSKIEGMAFGPEVTVGGAVRHTLFIANDNDFLPDLAGPNRFYVVAFGDADLPGYVPQAIAAP